LSKEQLHDRQTDIRTDGQARRTMRPHHMIPFVLSGYSD